MKTLIITAMKNNRRNFLKSAGMAGMSMAWLDAFPSSTNRNKIPYAKEWSSDPDWRKVKYGEWGGPGVPEGPGPMDPVLLKDHAPVSSVVTGETFVPVAKYPVIDVHTHTYPQRGKGNHSRELDRWVRTQKEVGVEKTIVLTGATGEKFDRFIEFYLEPYPDQFQLYCGLARNDINSPDYPQRAVQELERCYRMGARGIGELTDKGLGLTGDPELAPGERLHPDDPRLDAFWNKAAELNLPVNIHIADHPSAWRPPDVFQERTPVFQQFNRSGKEGLSYGDLIAIFPRLLKKHPGTIFIACHIANQGNDPGTLSRTMDNHPNLYLDISARDYELGRIPRAAKEFIIKYQDRVLFGTDMGMDKSMYQSWWRLLESNDEYMTGRIWWPYYGLGLPDPLLEKMYRTNALQILNWEKV
jgi:predicted TIM-barrel fold metal-dependent hydrolase